MKEPLNIGIIGGGITGLTLAYYFSKNGHRPVVFEKDSEPGGLMSTIELCGSRLEKHYHHIFTSDKYALELIKDLGLSEKIDWLKSSIGLFYNGKIYPFSTSLDLLKFPYLNIVDKLRSGLATIYLQYYKHGEKFKNKKASDWIKKHMGDNIWQMIWQPLFQGKFGKYYQDIAMSWFWSRIHFRAAAKFMKGEILGYPRSSFQEIIDTLVNKIIQKKGKLFLNQSVEKILCDDKQNISLMSRGKVYDFDLVLSTIAPPLLSRLLPDELRDFKKQLSEIVYIGNISTILILKEKLTDYYWTNISDKDISFAGIIEQTNFVEPTQYKNRHIAYISHYISSDSDYFTADNKELLDKYLVSLEKINPKIKSILEDVIIFKEVYTQPIITTDYPKKILQFQTPVKNLYQLSMAQIFPEDRGVDAAIRESKKLISFI